MISCRTPIYAQRETRKHKHRMAMLHPQKRSSHQPYKAPQRHGQRRIHPNDQTVPMDVDYASVNRAYTEADKIKWKAEGRCFRCDRQGHMARECPLRKEQEGRFKSFPKSSPPKQDFKKKSYNQPQRQQGFRKYNKPPRSKPFQARGAQIEEIDSDNKPKDNEEDTEDLAIRTLKLSDDKKERFLAEMRELDINF